MYDVPAPVPLLGGTAQSSDNGTQATGGGAPSNGTRTSENRVIVYDLATKQLEACVVTLHWV